MQLINQKVKFNGNDIKFSIPLSSKNTLDGHRESIESFITQERGLSINDVEDIEKTMFTPSPRPILNFEFFGGMNFNTSFNSAGFTNNEIETRSRNFIGSFFILQVYDTKVSETQTLLHTGYYNGYNFLEDSISNNNAVFITQTGREFNQYYLSNNFLNSFTGNSTTLYTRFYFYNAKTGNLSIFFNNNDGSNSANNESDLYFDLFISKSARGYAYPSTTLNAREIVNTEYNERINASVQSFDNKRPIFPTGNSFTSGRTYQVI